MFEQFRPLGDLVLVKKTNLEQKTDAGIYIPQEVDAGLHTGIVLATGPGRRNGDGNLIPMDVKVGETVYFLKYAGTDTGNDHLLMREDEILGIVDQ